MLAAPLPPVNTDSIVADSQAGSVVTYEIGSIKFVQAQHEAKMTDGVTFHHDSATMQMGAATASLGNDQSLQTAQSDTPVHIYDAYNDLTADHGTIDFRHHLARLEGNVVINVKPSKADQNAPKSSLRSSFTGTAVLTCSKLTYDYKSKFTTIPGTLTVHHQNRVLTSDMGTFDSKSEIATLIGHVHGHDSDGNILNGPSATMNVREGEEAIKLNGPVTGTFKVNDLTDDKPDTTTGSVKSPAAQNPNQNQEQGIPSKSGVSKKPIATPTDPLLQAQ